MGIDIDKIQRLKQAEQHKELTTSLGKLAAAISENKKDAEIAKAISKQTSDFVTAITNLPKPEAQKLPEVKIEYNHEKLVSLLNGFTDNIKESNQKVIEALENRLLPDTFELVKGYGGETQSVKVKYKSAKEINSKK